MRATGRTKSVVWRWQERFKHEEVDTGARQDPPAPPFHAHEWHARRARVPRRATIVGLTKEQVSRAWGLPAFKAAGVRRKVWSYNSGDDRTQTAMFDQSTRNASANGFGVGNNATPRERRSRRTPEWPSRTAGTAR